MHAKEEIHSAPNKSMGMCLNKFLLVQHQIPDVFKKIFPDLETKQSNITPSSISLSLLLRKILQGLVRRTLVTLQKTINSNIIGCFIPAIDNTL